MSRLAGSKRRWVGGEVTAAFPELTWSQPGDLATGSQLFAYVKGRGLWGGREGGSHRLGILRIVLLTLVPIPPISFGDREGASLSVQAGRWLWESQNCFLKEGRGWALQ